MRSFPVNHPFEVVYKNVGRPLSAIYKICKQIGDDHNMHATTLTNACCRMVKLTALITCDATAIAAAFRNH